MDVATRSVLNLTVHGIGTPTRSLEPGEDQVWIRVEQFEDVLDALVGRDDVRLTFDDSNLSDVKIALPRLLERGMTAEFFVLPGLLGEPGRLSADDVRALVDEGMAVGSHGWAHRDWRYLTGSEAHEEVDRARRELRRITGRQIAHVSVPFGSYDRHVLARLRRAGITRVYTSDGGRSGPHSWLQARNSLRHDVSAERLERLLSSAPTSAAVRIAAARLVKRTRGSIRSRPVEPPREAARRSDHERPDRIGVVVVTYNSARVLHSCLESLRDGADNVQLADVVVVDNASSDESVRIAEQYGAFRVRTIETGRNSGYAAGINVGIDALDLDRLDAVLVINPDCRLHRGALGVLADAMAETGAGIGVPLLINPDGSLQPSLRRTPSVGRSLAEAVFGRFADRIGGSGELANMPRSYERRGEWAWATGALMVVRTAVIADVGEWDESFLLYSEETDFALRAADRGWKLWFEPAAVVEHIGADSGDSPTLAALRTTNRVLLFRRRRSAAAGAAFFTAVLLGETARALAGRANSRASVTALVRPSHRLRSLPDKGDS